mgnify:CR=1 FL=1
MAHELETERLLMKQIEADDWSLFKDLHVCSSVAKYISYETS